MFGRMDPDKIKRDALRAIRKMTGGRYGKHARRGPQRDKYGEDVMWSTTKRRPWTVRQENRERNRRAKAHRKVNR